MAKRVRIELDDDDMDDLNRMAKDVGLTTAQLLENFAYDLVGSMYSNGSDERRLASEWYWRNRPNWG